VSAETDLGRALAAAVAEGEGTDLRFELCPGLLEIRFYASLGLPAYCYGRATSRCRMGPTSRSPSTPSRGAPRCTPWPRSE
jgi:succinyl-diaminopimelate desuccinylase